MEEHGGVFMDTTVDSSNLLLQTSLSSCVSAVVDGISIIGQVVDVAGGEVDVPLLVHKEAAGSGKAGGNVAAPLLSPKGVVCTVAAREKVADPLLAPEEVVCTDAARESVINEPTMPLLDLDPLQIRKNIGTASITYTLTMCKDFTLSLLLQKKEFSSCFFVK